MRTLPLFVAALSTAALAYGPAEPKWYAVNDGVMGGVSTGGPVADANRLLVFAGEISLKNNGGFSSVRADDIAWAPPGDGTIILTVKGDGRNYWMDLRTGARQGAFSYRLAFQTHADKEVTLRMPLANFRASAFGKNLPLAPALAPGRVVSLGFTLFDKKDGPFRLEVIGIRFEPAAEKSPAP